MPKSRLELALELLDSGDWRAFEKFASEFHAVAYPSLRTMASASGDRGRDAELYLPSEAPKVLLQFSVAADWSAKVRQTLVRVAAEFPDAKKLVYATNRQVGASGDDVRAAAEALGFSLDFHDRSWFVERELTNPQRATAAEELARAFVDPVLAPRSLSTRVSTRLGNEASKVAMVHLALEGYDANSDKGLTRSCFEALVRSALRDTSADSTKSSDEVVAAVRELIPAGSADQVRAQTLGALGRLCASSKSGAVKHVRKVNRYHLSFAEQERLSQELARFILEDEELVAELSAKVANSLPTHPQADLSRVTALAKQALGELLYRQGEQFAAAVITGRMDTVDQQTVQSLLTELGAEPAINRALASVVLDLLQDPGTATKRHLKQLADGYTLFAFLRETPDVQRVILDVFQSGDIWLDTNVVLPAIAETLIAVPDQRQFTSLLRAARDSGMNLYVTDGVVEEVLGHMLRCITYSRQHGDWEGPAPFLVGAYLMNGKPLDGFVSWIEEWRHRDSPDADLLAVLEEEFGIQHRDLAEAADSADVSLRGAVHEVWAEARERRRALRGEPEGQNDHRLVAHDVESCVGVIQLRKSSGMGPLGYREWWLTLDRIAFGIEGQLRAALGASSPRSPALSPDFLTQLLRLGPLRSALENDVKVSLPVMAGMGRFESLPPKLIEIANDVRRSMEGQGERAIEWGVRSQLNDARWRLGEAAQAGVQGVEAQVMEGLRGHGTSNS